MFNNQKDVIILLGDSILDNYNNIPNKERDLKKELNDLGFMVNNYAVTGSLLQHLIDGIDPKYHTIEPRFYPAENDGKVYPLKLLINRHNSGFKSLYGNLGIRPIGLNTTSTTDNELAVLSIGGNDLKVGPYRIVLGFDYFYNSVVNPDFIDKYETLIIDITKQCPRLLIVCMYLPYMGSGSFYATFSNFADTLITKWYLFLKDLAKKYNLPILDLSRTLDRNNKNHYGVSEVDLSNISNKCLADCISFIYHNYDGHHEYYAPNCDISQIQVI